jgi:hypothetical protein
VYPLGLEAGHSGNAIRPAVLSGGGDLGVTANPDPYHWKSCQGCGQPFLR